MPVLLKLDSSADIAGSRSRSLTAAFADAWRARGPEYTVVERDLHVDALPHLVTPAQHWPEGDRGGEAVPAHLEELQREIVDELIAADVVLIGAPMYNYSLPSTLKAWVDYVHVPGLTAIDGGGPLAGRTAVVVTARGASYDPGSPTDGWDHGVPVLQLILGASMGMEVKVIATSRTLADRIPALDRDRAEAELAAALDDARALAAHL